MTKVSTLNAPDRMTVGHRFHAKHSSTFSHQKVAFPVMNSLAPHARLMFFSDWAHILRVAHFETFIAKIMLRTLFHFMVGR